MMNLPNRKLEELIDDDKNKAIIDLNRQQLIGILGRRGQGKSYLTEALTAIFKKSSITVLDLWSSDNWENAFVWCIPKLEDSEIEDFIKHPNNYNKRTRQPITILCSNTLRYDQSKLDRFNGKLFIEKEFYKYYSGQDKIFNCVYPQTKPDSIQGTEWIKFVSLPNPTAKYESEINIQIGKIIEKTILDCRENGRILVFNQRAFSNETLMFRTLEIIIRNLGQISLKHFRRLSPQQVGKTTRKEMTAKEKAHDKMVFCVREFAELCPAKLKSDASGESVRVKKALLSFVRKCRHYSISGICDWQSSSDAESSIRNQFDCWLIKKWTTRLAGEQFEFAFKKIDAMRSAIISKYRNGKQGFKVANTMYPPLDALGQKFMYCVLGNDNLKLRKVPEVKTRHKEPYDSFERFVGIEFWHEKSLVAIQNAVHDGGTAKSDEKALYNAIYALRNKKTGKATKWEDCIPKLAEMQEKNELHWSKVIKEMKPATLQKWFIRASKRFTE